MSYITKDDLLKSIPEEKLIELTDDNETGVVNDEILLDAISKAESLIDSYLRKRIKKLPLSEVPKIIKGFAVDITIYFLESRLERATEGRTQNYKDAVAFLKDFSRGLIEIEGIEESIGYRESSRMEIETSKKIFSDELLDKYRI